MQWVLIPIRIARLMIMIMMMITIMLLIIMAGPFHAP